MSERSNELKSKNKVSIYLFNILKGMVIVIFISLVLLGALLLYLQLSGFDIENNQKGVGAYLQSVDSENMMSVSGNRITLELPAEVVDTELMKHFNQSELPTYFDIENIQIDSEKSLVYINSSVYGFKMPFSCEFNQTFTDNTLKIELEQVALGNKQLGVFEPISDHMLKTLFASQLPISIDMDEYNAYDFLEVEGVALVGEGAIASLLVAEDWVISQLNEINEAADEELLNLYTTSNNLKMNLAANYIVNTERLQNQDIETLIEDVISEKQIIFRILLLAEEEKVEKLDSQYNGLFNSINIEQIQETKANMLSDFLMEYREDILEALEVNYFSEDIMYINHGNPYGFGDIGMVSLQRVVEESDMIIPESTSEKLAFCYDFDQDKLLISYQIDGGSYLILDEEERYVLDTQTYEEHYGYEETGEAVMTNSVEIWDELYDMVSDYLGAEEVFIRYMKNDEQYAFVIASPSYSFQNYWVFAFKKYGDRWEYLQKNINNIEKFNLANKDFNLEVATDEIDTITVYNLEENMYSVILQDLINKGVIESTSELTIEYCSYGNVYIACRLSNGNEYVYKVNKSYLETVYTKQDAIINWPDLPVIIYIQDKPNTE
jgi:hypothetical protein